MFSKRFLTLVAVFFVLLAVPLVVSAAVAPIQVNDDTGYVHDYPEAVVLKDGTIVVAYQMQSDDTNGQVMIARSMDGGIHWTDHRFINQGSLYQTVPRMATDGRNIWVVLSEKDITTPVGVIDNDIVLYTSHDAGFSWSRRELNEVDPGGRDAYPIIYYAGNCLYVVWVDGSAASYDQSSTVLRRSCDAGESWSSQITINSSGMPSDMILIHEQLLLAFTSTQRRPWYPDVYVTSSKSFGEVWSAPVLISAALPDWYRARHPQFVTDSGTLRLVWWDDMYGHFKGIQSIYESTGNWSDAEIVPALEWMHQAHVANYAGKGFLAWRNQYGEALIVSTIVHDEWMEVYRFDSSEGLAVNNPFLLGQGRLGLRAFWNWALPNGRGDVVTLSVGQ